MSEVFDLENDGTLRCIKCGKVISRNLVDFGDSLYLSWICGCGVQYVCTLNIRSNIVVVPAEVG